MKLLIPVRREVVPDLFRADPETRFRHDQLIARNDHLASKDSVRYDKVELIRQQLAAGTYDPDGMKFNLAVGKLHDRLFPEW